MKVLWVCNIMLPVIATQLGLPYSNREGWLSGLADKILQNKNSLNLDLAISFPTSGETGNLSANLPIGVNTSVPCYGFVENLEHPEKYDASLERRFAEILEEFKPDIVHIFGTEFPHTLACVKAFDKPNQTLIGMQGVISACAKAYTANIPLSVKYKLTLRDVLKRDSIWQQQEKFRKRGVYEIEAVKRVGNITGRTDFDKKETGIMNPKASYYFLNETMRSCFYRDSWKLENCEKHRIFLSAGDYPLKGFHYVLQAMPKILAQYPDAKICVAGANLLNEETWKERLKRPAYGTYLKKLIRKNKLKNHVEMLGRITAEQMKEQYLKAHVFVCPSSLENSPNSLGEAMLLGVPSVAADVGGIHNLLENGQDGLLYPAANIDMLAEKIIEIFTKEEVTKLYSISAKKHAYKTHDGEINYRRLMGIYREIYEKNNNNLRF